ncbi:S9 family peptidase [Shouchella shacheensis]|uniref:S9 family peptidase n=1 Tax=Shouchella shacheensis TaxID=1649580 RepID=UPI00073FB371|nr:S9 family peptidase [Shouchella shacheensis]
MAKRAVKAEDLYKLKTVTAPDLAPHGERALVVVTELSREQNDYEAHIYEVDVHKKQKATPLTFGKSKNIAPRWSPSGEAFAFLSNRTESMQVFMKEGLADARQVTDEKRGVTDFDWSPGGDKLALTIRTGEGKKEEQELPVPLVVDEMKYKSDGRGFHDNSTQQVVVIDVASGKRTPLTDEPYDVTPLCWSPDGNNLLVSADDAENRDLSFTSDLWVYSLGANKKEKLTDGSFVIGQAAYCPDGSTIAFLGHQRQFENATQADLWLYDLQKAELRCLTENVDVAIGDLGIGDFLQNVGGAGLRWSEDGQSIYALVSREGHVNVWRFYLSGEVEEITAGSHHVHGFSLKSEGTGVVTLSKPSEPSEAYALSLHSGELAKITAVNEEVVQELELSLPEEFRLEREDGSAVSGWMMKPAGFEADKKYPFILEVHGGPHAMYATTYFHEFQLLCARGYGVLFTNPRGGFGYGQKFVDAVRGDYGGGDYQDLMDALDQALDQYEWIDRDRLGLTGGSYGGFMTNWAVGHTNRFKAAVTQRSICNWVSFYGVSDIGYYFSEWQIQANLDDIKTLWHHSPLKYVDQIETPLLILHGEKDFRCPIEQAEQLYIALKHKGKQTRFMRFPEANHELSRSGKPNLRMERLQAIAGWFDEHL